MRVLFALSVGDVSGCELATVTTLRDRPADVECSAILLSPGPLAEELDRIGVENSSLASRSTSPLGRIKLAAALDTAVAALRPDIVYASGNKAAMLAVPSSRLRRIPLVWQKCDSRYDRRGARLLALQCRRVVAVSHSCGAVVPFDRLSVVYPPVRLGREFKVSPDRPSAVIGAVGRLDPWKGHVDLIAATAILSREIPDIRLVIRGTEAPYARGYHQTLRRVAGAYEIESRVDIRLTTARLEEFLSQLTVLAGASYVDSRGRGGEAFGLALAEASWAGLPVVATRVGGVPEHVSDGETGVLVPQRRPDRLASALRRVLTDPDWARKLGETGAERARARFAPDVISHQLFEQLRPCA